jgi:hypothetical protein
MPMPMAGKTPLIFVQESTKKGRTLYEVMDYTRVERRVDVFSTRAEADAAVQQLAGGH